MEAELEQITINTINYYYYFLLTFTNNVFFYVKKKNTILFTLIYRLAGIKTLFFLLFYRLAGKINTILFWFGWIVCVADNMYSTENLCSQRKSNSVFKCFF